MTQGPRYGGWELASSPSLRQIQLRFKVTTERDLDLRILSSSTKTTPSLSLSLLILVDTRHPNQKQKNSVIHQDKKFSQLRKQRPPSARSAIHNRKYKTPYPHRKYPHWDGNAKEIRHLGMMRPPCQICGVAQKGRGDVVAMMFVMRKSSRRRRAAQQRCSFRHRCLFSCVFLFSSLLFFSSLSLYVRSQTPLVCMSLY